MRRLTDWDCWVLVAIVFSLIGWAVTISMMYLPATRTLSGHLAAGSAQVWAFVFLIVAYRGPSWLID